MKETDRGLTRYGAGKICGEEGHETRKGTELGRYGAGKAMSPEMIKNEEGHANQEGCGDRNGERDNDTGN